MFSPKAALPIVEEWEALPVVDDFEIWGDVSDECRELSGELVGDDDGEVLDADFSLSLSLSLSQVRVLIDAEWEILSIEDNLQIRRDVGN